MKNISKLAPFLIYLVFFIPYIGVVYPAYFLVILTIFFCFYCGRIRLKKSDFFVAFLLIVFVFFKIAQVGLIKTELFIRYYFGWFLLYGFMYITKSRISIIRLFALFCICVIIEAFVVNTLIPADFWPNYPDFEGNTHRTNYFGFYQRVYSIGTNASVSSSILNLLLFYIESLRKKGVRLMSKRLELLGFVAMVLFASGVGMLFYFIYWLYKLSFFSKKKYFLFLLVFVCLFVILSIYASSLQTSNVLSKISAIYFKELFSLKRAQFVETISSLSQSSYLIGYDYPNNQQPLVWSDFALRDMIHSVGFLGFGSLIFLYLTRVNKYNITILSIGILSALHYGSIFAISGQLIFAYALLLNKDTINFYTRDDVQKTTMRRSNYLRNVAFLVRPCYMHEK